MTFKTQATVDLSVFFNSDEFAEIVSYTAKGGAAVDITAVVTREGAHQEPHVRGPSTAIGSVMVKKSEVPTPLHGDTYVFDSQTWEHDPENGVVYEDDQIHEIAIRRRD
jgi:hypothetical protein